MAWKRSDETDRMSVLGLGGVTPDRTRESGDEPAEPVGTSGEVETISGAGSLEPSKGATGIDMGAGGEGTDIKP